MDVFCIYSAKGKLLIEKIFNDDFTRNELHIELKSLIKNKKVSNNYCLVLYNDVEKVAHGEVGEKEAGEKEEDENGAEGADKFSENRLANNFVYYIKKDGIYFISVKKNENNPILIIEIIQEIIKNIKQYFNINKLEEYIFLNNYSLVNFLMNEILVYGGKPSLFINNILKNLIKNDYNFLKDTLNYSHISNNIYNLIKKNNNNFYSNSYNENNINYSYSNGTCIHSNDSMHIYWRHNNIYYSTNEIYVDIIEYVNCIVNNFNKIIFYYIKGDVHIKCYVSGSPIIKLHFNDFIDFKNCHFHFTVNYSKLFKKDNLNNKMNVIYFVPLNEEYVVMRYFYYPQIGFPGSGKFRGKEENVGNISWGERGCLDSTDDQLTNVLNLNCTSGEASREEASKEETSKEETSKEEAAKKEAAKKEAAKKEAAKKEAAKKEASKEEPMPSKDAATFGESRGNYDKRELFSPDSVPNSDEAIHKKVFGETFSYEDTTVEEGATEENLNMREYPFKNYEYTDILDGMDRGISSFCHMENVRNSRVMNLNMDNSSFMFDREENIAKLPLTVKGQVLYIPPEYMYKIKINVVLNNINNKKNSNLLLNRYENILLKIPVHNFIQSVNFHSTIGKLQYKEKINCILWYIDSVSDTNTVISATISLYMKPNGQFPHDTSASCTEVAWHRSEQSWGKRCGEQSLWSSPEVHGAYYRDNQDERYANSFSIYPFFNFVVYASLKVNGLSITGRKIEKIEVIESKHLDVQKGCRYSTYFTDLEFRI
ncbi:adaptor complexes medium subunit family [Plasmodium ovale]|uniref:Adaptor complexes medium subunit family n=1 Tax=Plasmodium ovale TaxID=36330 RepID=A0A1C3KUU2_PLAOA|nr:adaptor complexes medium subunit family [Plasmodium ovale]